MPDYQKTVIYKIINYDLPEYIYIGHTTNFTKRKQHHKEATYSTAKSNNQYDRKLYKTIRDNGVWGDWKMIIIKDFPCETKREAETEEQKYMTEIGTLNVIHAIRSREQRREDNWEIIKESRSKKYTCDCGITSSHDHKARHERSKGHIYRMFYIIDKKYSILLKQFDDIIKLQ